MYKDKNVVYGTFYMKQENIPAIIMIHVSGHLNVKESNH